jgi:very-short-patch-repair endonuclease
MAYIGKTVEWQVYYGAKKDTILFARELRKEMTDAEEVLWSKLRKKQVNGFVFRRQHPIDFYIVDFYCHKLKLVIEVDGEIHNLPEIFEYDKGRAAELERLGLKVIRFTNQQVLFETEEVINIIKQHTK